MIALLRSVGQVWLRWRLYWWLPAALILGFVLVAHGCHGDEDHELFARLGPG
jgi:hypothetical protein